MRISELSAASEVSVATIKYYLREGLLPGGEPVARNQSDYGPAHLARLRPIRVLTEVGGLHLEDVRGVLGALDDPEPPPLGAIRSAHRALAGRARTVHARTHETEAREAVPAVAEERGWRLDADTPALDRACDAVDAVLAMDLPGFHPLLDLYADLAETMARHEVAASLAFGGTPEVVRGIVVGTVIGEALLNAMRLLAQQAVSKELYADVSAHV